MAGLLSISVDSSLNAGRSDSSIPSATQGSLAALTGTGVGVGTSVGVGVGAGVVVGLGVGAGVAAGIAVGMVVGVGDTRVAVGAAAGGVRGWAVEEARFSLASDGEDAAVGGESDWSGHGVSIASVNMANP